MTEVQRKPYAILWIDDQSTSYSEWSAPLDTSRKYELVEVGDATSALDRIKETEFDAVIVDIRILPGINPNWCSHFARFKEDKTAARLGLVLLRVLLAPEQAPSDLRVTVPKWVQEGRDRFGVLTVEGTGELMDDINSLGITEFEQKTRNIDEDTLRNMVDHILKKIPQHDPRRNNHVVIS